MAVYASNPVVIDAVPSAPTVNAPTVTQPTCATPTGTVAVNATGSGTLEHSVDNGNNWQASGTFTGLAPGSYDIKVRLQSDPSCMAVYASNPVVIDAVPSAPTVNAPTVTQPTCATPTGTVAVNATGSGTLEHSVDNGNNWQASGTFTGLAPGNYDIKVRLQSDPSCMAAYASNPVVLNAPTGCCTPPVVTAPAVTQPTCATPTGTIAVNATGSGALEHSVDNGSSWQASGTFTGLAPGSYDIKVRLQSDPSCMTAYAQNPVVLGTPPSPQTWYKDIDNDLYSDGTSQQSCTQPPGYKLAGDLTQTSGDCNDNIGSINPDADEICDGFDNDCDGTTDENPVTGPTWFEDSDGDGFGNANSTVIACSQPTGYVNNSLDCNDSDSSINPSAPEICNNVDDNCNGQIDDFAVDAPTWYEDSDMDGFGNLNSILVDCDQPAGYVNNFDDCDDTDSAINPNTIWYVDFDGDGFGNPNTSVTTCNPGAGFSLDNTDCNDNVAAINPDATELCNGVDDDCDSIIDEGCTCNITSITATNFSACDNQGTLDPLDDTFEADVTVIFTSPPGTGTLDLSGDGTASVSVVGLGNSHTFVGVEMSADGNIISLTANFSDDLMCTLTNSNVGTAPSECSNCSVAIDSINVTDETCPQAGDGTITISASGSGQIAYSIDGGSTFNLTGQFVGVSPGSYDIKVWILGTPTCSATDVATVDPAPSSALKTWYKDADGDGYSDGASLESCTQPANFFLEDDLTAISGDCNDNDADEYPGQTWYKDADDDGYSDGTSQTACSRPIDHKTSDELTATSGDCNDGDAAIFPGAPEICNGIDDDCDGEVDENAAGGLTFNGNVFLTTQAAVDAFSSCYSIIDGNLTVQGANVVNLDSLKNIVEVTGNVNIQYTFVEDMNGLDSLHEVGGTMTVFFNSQLTSLDGLDSLEEVGASLMIYYNFSLKGCCPIYDLINSGNIGGATVIFFNSNNCNSVADINAACSNNPLVEPPTGNGLQVRTPSSGFEPGKDFNLFPNPADEFVNILIFGNYQEGRLKIFDTTGKTVTERRFGQNVVEEKIFVTDWRPGIYLAQVILDDKILVKKLVIQ